VIKRFCGVQQKAATCHPRHRKYPPRGMRCGQAGMQTMPIEQGLAGGGSAAAQPLTQAANDVASNFHNWPYSHGMVNIR